MSKLFKSWLCNVQVCQHVVEWWENQLLSVQFVHNYFGIMAKIKQTARKNTGGGASQNSKFILYHIIYLQTSVLHDSLVGFVGIRHKYMYVYLHIVGICRKEENDPQYKTTTHATSCIETQEGWRWRRWR